MQCSSTYATMMLVASRTAVVRNALQQLPMGTRCLRAIWMAPLQKK